MPPRVAYGPAQDAFIKKTRIEIDASGSKYFHTRDWTMLAPARGRNTCLHNDDLSMYADTFYIKPIAAWVPHLLFPGYLPSCYRCESNMYIDIRKSSWVKRPKILHGLRRHRYLDTYLYYCRNCQASFAGYNELYLKRDVRSLLGVFNFHVAKGFAVDDEVYSYIVNHAQNTTASIYKSLALMTTDNYLDDCMYYCQAVRANKIKAQPPNTQPGNRGQRTLDAIAQPAVNDPNGPLRIQLKAVTRELRHKELSFESDVDFTDVFKRKSNRNNIGLPFKGIGRKKLLTLIEREICTAKELLEYDGTDPAVLPHWKTIVENYYDKLRTEVAVLKQQKKGLEERLKEAEEELVPPVVNNEPERNDGVNTTVAPEKPPGFSKLTDPLKYNARCLSKRTIDRIVATDFQARKELQEAKMRNIPFKILKIDFHYKLAPRLKVYTGRGKSFSPYVSAVTIHQEDALTIFWKAFAQHESFEVLLPDLERIKERGNLLGCNVRGCYVDNCCSVRSKLGRIFPGAFVKLDIFHWMVRWDDILLDTNSAEATIFRRLMRKAIFVVENSEYNRVKWLLRGKLGRPPTAKEVLKKAKATVPAKEILERRINAVLRFVYFSDLATDLRDTAPVHSSENSTGLLQKRFFKRLSPDIKRLIRNQLQHVKNDCLSDPPSDVIKIIRVNSETNEAYTARSTGSCETDHRRLNALLETPTVGLPRGERLIWDYYERSNDNKQCLRLGEEALTHRSEKLYLLNSVADSVGFTDDDIPHRTKAPPNLNLKEYIGLSYELPKCFQLEEPSGEEDDDDDGEEGANDLANFIQGMQFDDPENEDIPVDASQFENADTAEQDPLIAEHMDLEPIPLQDSAVIDAEVEKQLERVHLPELVQNESTFQAFCRLTQDQPFTAFAKPGGADLSVLEKAEHNLFEEMMGQYERRANLDSAKGYKRFASKWESEVATRFKDNVEGNADAKPLIYRKSYRQLQVYHDELVKHKQAATVVRPNDAFHTQMNDELRQTRRNMPPQQEAHFCQPIQYNNELGNVPFGAPMVLNTHIAADAVRYRTTRNDNAPFVVLPPRQSQAPMAMLNPLGNNFKRNKYCWRCGFQKREHSRLGVPFGEQCKDNCHHEECSKCNLRLTFHQNGKVGPYCVNEASQYSKYSDWFKQST